MLRKVAKDPTIMSNRHPDKVMMDSWGAFDTAIQLSNKALADGKAARFKNLSELVHETFFKFNRDWRNYKADTIKKTAKTEEAFYEERLEGEEKVKEFPYNDSWSKEQMKVYSDTMEKLENGDIQEKAVEATSEKADIELLVMCSKSELQNLETEISAAEATILNLEDSSISIFSKTLYDAQITELSSRLHDGLVVKTNKVLVAPVESSDSSYSKENVKSKLESFINTQQVKLGRCSSTLIQKVKSDLTTLELKHPVTPSSTIPGSQIKPREQVQLEKTKPPKFNGEDIEFPEFQRKWTSLVTKANLPEETELDKLRDNIPKEAKEQLFGVKKVKNSNYILVQDGENGCIRWMKRLGKSGSVRLGLSLFQYQSKPSRTEIFSHI